MNMDHVTVSVYVRAHEVQYDTKVHVACAMSVVTHVHTMHSSLSSRVNYFRSLCIRIECVICMYHSIQRMHCVHFTVCTIRTIYYVLQALFVSNITFLYSYGIVRHVFYAPYVCVHSLYNMIIVGYVSYVVYESSIFYVLHVFSIFHVLYVLNVRCLLVSYHRLIM